MSNNTVNYMVQGGAEWHIGGKLIVDDGGQVEGLLSTAAENQAASTATTVATLKEDLNALLAKLKAAGIMEADPEPEPDET